MATTEKPPRRIDRNRRARIIAGATEVIEQDGVAALTHRRAAAAAGVPLAATTYYFDSLGDLLAAALQQLVERDLIDLRERVDAVPEGASMAPLFARFICEGATTSERTGVMTTEFWAAGLRHEQVREVALAWHQAWLEILEPRLGRNTALAAMAAVGGLSQHALLAREQPSEDDLIAVMREIVPDPS